MKSNEMRCRTTALEMRGKPGEGAILSGYVAVFDEPSEVLWEYGVGRFIERIAPRAFDKTVREADIRATKNHDPNYIVGRTKAGVGNFRLAPDTVGLYHELDVPDTATARSVYEDVQNGFIDQMSFAFRMIDDAWDMDAEIPERRLLEVALEDIAYVAYPAYPQTTADARAALRSYARAAGVDVEELPTIAATATTQEPSGPPETAPEITPEPERPEPKRTTNLLIGL